MVSLYCPPGLAPSVQGSRPLCSAQLLLAAPKIAGLLPARITSTPQITVFKPRESLLDRQRAIWAAQDAELEAFLDGARQRLTALFAEVEHDAANRSARPFFWEITS